MAYNSKFSGTEIDEGIEKARAIPDGGTTGQVLTKKSGANNDFQYQNANAHTHSPSQLTSGSLPTGVKAAVGTDYTVSRLRNIKAGTADLEAGVSELENGTIYIVYE